MYTRVKFVGGSRDVSFTCRKQICRLSTKRGGPLDDKKRWASCRRKEVGRLSNAKNLQSKHKNGVWPCSLVCGKGRKPVAAPGRVKGEEQLSVVKIKMSQCGKLLF